MSIFTPDKLSQVINPWTWWLKLTDNVNGLVNIVTYKSNNPDTEQKIIQEVAGYGMQLDAIETVLMIMLEKLPDKDITETEQKQIKDFRKMVYEIQQKKQDILFEQFSAGGINKFLRDLEVLKKEYPKRYAEIKEKLEEKL